MKVFIVESINYLGSELEVQFEIGLIDGGELNFNKSFLHFNVKKKIYAKVTLKLTVNIEY